MTQPVLHRFSSNQKLQNETSLPLKPPATDQPSNKIWLIAVMYLNSTGYLKQNMIHPTQTYSFNKKQKRNLSHYTTV